MTDLSYTNKDGLNLYEGFNNGFDYHKDGKESGDGYEHGGYPEITGETSEYTDTSYKTGDNPDFWGNGNVWEQPSAGPEPGPGPEPYIVTLKPIVATGGVEVTPISREDLPELVTEGTLFEIEEDVAYNVTYNGTTYENLTATWYEAEGTTIGFDGFGNVGSMVLRSNYAQSFSEEERAAFVESDIPFAILTTTGVNLALGFFGTNTEQTITITRVSDSASFTLSLTSSELSLVEPAMYTPTQTFEYLTEMLNIKEDGKVKIIIGENEHDGTWTVTEEMGTLLLYDNYTPETIMTAPIVVFVGTKSGESCLTFGSAVMANEEFTASFVRETETAEIE